MKATKRGMALIVGCSCILASVTAIGCSDKSHAGKPASDRGASGIFEKGKTYNIATNGVLGETAVTVTEIGPGPWLKVKVGVSEAELWLNANYITMVDSETPKAASKAPPQAPPASRPAAPVSLIDTGTGEIPLQTNGVDVPPDGLKQLGGLCRQYMVKRGDSWFMCRVNGDEKQVCEYRGVEASVGRQDLSQADKLNGYQWRGYCNCRGAAKRCYAKGKWEAWSDTTGMFGGSYMWGTDLNNKRGVWETKIEGFLPTSEWSIP